MIGDKKPKPAERTVKVVKSDDERRKAHVAKVAHCVESIEKWTVYLTKGMKSRKYPLTDEQKAKIREKLTTIQTTFDKSLSTEEKAEPKFTLE